MLVVELNSLDPRIFEDIQDFFMNFKSLLLHLKGCGIDKSTQHNKLILYNLEKIGPDYVVFISKCHIVRFMLWREIPMAWGTTTDILIPEINPFQYAIESKCLTLKDQTSYLIPDG